MKQAKLALAIGLGLAASSAWSAISPPVITDNRLYVSGATASDQALGRLMLGEAGVGLCTGTPDVYTTAADPLVANPASTALDRFQAAFGAANKVVACTASAQTDVAGERIALFKESTAG